MDERLRAYLADTPEDMEPPDFNAVIKEWWRRLATEAEVFKRAADWPARVEDKDARKADKGPLKVVAQRLLNRHLSWSAMMNQTPLWRRFEDFKAPVSDPDLVPEIGALLPSDRLADVIEEVDRLLVITTYCVKRNVDKAWQRGAHRLLKDRDELVWCQDYISDFEVDVLEEQLWVD